MKKKLKEKSFMTIIIMVIMIVMSTTVNAATGANYSVGMSLTSDSKLSAGDTVTVNINLTKINAGNGIDTISAELNYDTNVFEILSTSNFVSNNNWIPSYEASTNMITLLKNSKVTAPETVLTINFKVKASINVNSTTITLKEVVATSGIIADGGTGDITVNDTSVTISKIKELTNTKEHTNTTVDKNTADKNTVDKNTIKDNSVTKTTTLPKAGLQQYGVVSIVSVIIVTIFSYIAYRKISKYVK